MSREIKFRAICDADDVVQMVYFGVEEFDDGIKAWPMPNNISRIDHYESPLMQFTGLKDLHGKEIYEDDIVKWGHIKGGEEKPIRYAIVKISPDLQFKMIYEDYSFHFGSFIYTDTEKYLEVIGNIFENPELLTP